VKLSGVAASALAQQLQPSEINNLLELQSTSAGTTTPSSSYRFISLSSLFSSLCPAGSVFSGAVWTRMFQNHVRLIFATAPTRSKWRHRRHVTKHWWRGRRLKKKTFFLRDFRRQSSLWLIVCIYPHLWSF